LGQNLIVATNLDDRKVKIRYGEQVLQDLPMLDPNGCVWVQSMDFAGINTPGEYYLHFDDFLTNLFVFWFKSSLFLQPLWE
jgi:hypothetical protein